MCDLNTVFILGLASSFATNIVVLIYGLISEQTIFQSDASIVTISMVIFYWQARFWLLVQRNEVNDDPVKFALKDKISLLVIVILGIISGLEQVVY